MPSFITLALVGLAASVFAAPTPLEKRCDVGPTDPNMVNIVYKTAKSRGVTDQVSPTPFRRHQSAG